MILSTLTAAALAATAEPDPVCPSLLDPLDPAYDACHCVLDATSSDWTPLDTGKTDPTSTCFEFTSIVNGINTTTGRKKALNRLEPRAFDEACSLGRGFSFWASSSYTVTSQLLSMDESCGMGTKTLAFEWSAPDQLWLVVDPLSGTPIVQLDGAGRTPASGYWVDDDDDGVLELFIVFDTFEAWWVDGPIVVGDIVHPPLPAP